MPEPLFSSRAINTMKTCRTVNSAKLKDILGTRLAMAPKGVLRGASDALMLVKQDQKNNRLNILLEVGDSGRGVSRRQTWQASIYRAVSNKSPDLTRNKLGAQKGDTRP